MTINRASLAEALRAIGRAFVYAGDATTSGGLTVLGQTEGEITVEEIETYNDLTLPELTGDAVHVRKVLQGGARVTIPLLMGEQEGSGSDDGSAVYAKISSIGSGAGGGYDEQQDVVTTTLLVVPEREVPSGGLSFISGAWSPNEPPVHAVWMWKAVAEVSEMAFRHGEGGKIVREVPFLTLYDDSKPSGHKLWTRGDPDAYGVTIEI
jgi:hypothetical protein